MLLCVFQLIPNTPQFDGADGELGPEFLSESDPSSLTWRILVSSSAVILGRRLMNSAFDSPLPRAPSSISSSLLSSTKHQPELRGELPLRRWTVATVWTAVAGAVFGSCHIDSIPRTAGWELGDTDRGDPVVALFVAVVSCVVSCMFNFDACLTGIMSFSAAEPELADAVVIKTCSDGSIRSVYCLNKGSETAAVCFVGGYIRISTCPSDEGRRKLPVP